MFQGKIDYNEIVTKLNGFSLEFHECAKFRFEWSGRNLHSFNRIFAVIATDGNSEVIHEQSGKKYILKTGGIYFLSNGETYKFKFDSATYFLSFHFNCYVDGCREIFADSNIFTELLTDSEWVIKVEKLLKENISIAEYSQLYRCLCEKVSEFIPEIDTEIHLLYQRDMRIHRFLRNEADAKTVIEDLADIAGLSADTLSRRFSKDYKKTLKKAINQAIAMRAEKFLRNDELKVKEIAEILKFNDEYYFSKFFKRESGKSPSEFRKMRGIIRHTS